ncbi:MAG TPA: penicillin acylase family protein, partial [Mucilaginibacter sp.]
TCSDIINSAFIDVVDSLTHKYGRPGKSWQWGLTKEMDIRHLTGQEALSTGNFASPGTGTTVNALNNNHGPSWRMVVQMGPTVKGYGILPGGESGNPGSFFYDDMLKTWQNGQLKELLFLQSPEEVSNRIKSTLTISNKK